MAKSPTHKVPFKRRREKKTNYVKRLALVRSGKARLVVRRSNSNIYAQIVEFSPAGDKTIASANGKDLSEFGWKTPSLGNIPSAYLVGYLLAKRTPVKEAILDIGMQKPAKGGKLFAVLKGAVDGGMQIPFDKEAIPTEERITGAHISGAPSTFSLYKKSGADPKAIPESFKATKEKILSKKE